MLIGQVYRLKVGEHRAATKGEEVFPTIEVIDRLYPPPGQAARFPIPIELTAGRARDGPRRPLRAAGDLRRRAADGPARCAMCRASSGTSKSAPGEDAMEAADRLGRPVAILRMGSRVPLPDEDQSQFLYHSRRCCCSEAAAGHAAERRPGRAARRAAAAGPAEPEFPAAAGIEAAVA